MFKPRPKFIWMAVGFVTLNDTENPRIVYYNANGQMQYGEQKRLCPYNWCKF